MQIDSSQTARKIGNDIEILALGFLVICSPLQTPIAMDQYPYLQDLELADVDCIYKVLKDRQGGGHFSSQWHKL